MFLSGLPTTVRHVCNYNKEAQVTLLIGDDEKKNTLTELGCNQWLSFPPFLSIKLCNHTFGFTSRYWLCQRHQYCSCVIDGFSMFKYFFRYFDLWCRTL